MYVFYCIYFLGYMPYMPGQYWLYLSPEGSEKTSFQFSKNSFPIDRVIINLDCYIWEIEFIRKNTSLQ